MRVPFDGRVTVTGETLRIELDTRLPTPNDSRGWHWRKKNRIRKDIEVSIDWALTRRGLAVFPTGWLPCKRTVHITRVVDSKRKFIKDSADNLPFAGKPVYDALVNLGLLFGDEDEWLDGRVTQELGSQDQTVVALSPYPA